MGKANKQAKVREREDQELNELIGSLSPKTDTPASDGPEEEKLKELLTELRWSRKALDSIMERVSRSWDNPDSTLEFIGDTIDSERYPVWEIYEENN